MFVSMPDYDFYVPPQLAIPGALYSRAMTLTTHAAWFVLALRTLEEEPTLETFVLAWDTDVAQVLETSGRNFESLMFVAPQSVQGRCRWTSKQIVEVWRATDPEDESECVLMLAEDGQEHSGFFMEVKTNIQRRQLVACRPEGARHV